MEKLSGLVAEDEVWGLVKVYLGLFDMESDRPYVDPGEDYQWCVPVFKSGERYGGVVRGYGRSVFEAAANGVRGYQEDSEGNQEGSDRLRLQKRIAVKLSGWNEKGFESTPKSSQDQWMLMASDVLEIMEEEGWQG